MNIFVPLQQCVKTRKSSAIRKYHSPLDLVKQRLGEFNWRNLQAAFDESSKFNRSQKLKPTYTCLGSNPKFCNSFYFNLHMHYNFVVVYTPTYVSTTY
jgi:hypothetical protein